MHKIYSMALVWSQYVGSWQIPRWMTNSAWYIYQPFLILSSPLDSL